MGVDSRLLAAILFVATPAFAQGKKGVFKSFKHNKPNSFLLDVLFFCLGSHLFNFNLG